jgi:hypothetical protein
MLNVRSSIMTSEPFRFQGMDVINKFSKRSDQVKETLIGVHRLET